MSDEIRFKCGACGSKWFQNEQRTVCWNCESTLRIPIDAPLDPEASAAFLAEGGKPPPLRDRVAAAPARPEAPIGQLPNTPEWSQQRSAPLRAPHQVQSDTPVSVVNQSYQRIGEIRLTWGNVFELAFMFSVAFVVIDAVVIVALALIIAAVLR